MKRYWKDFARPALFVLAGIATVTGVRAEDARLVQGDDPYYKQADGALNQILKRQKNTNRAKNVILVVGDGMGFSTVTAARIFEGQQRGVETNPMSLPGRRFLTWPLPRLIPPMPRSPIPRRARLP